MRSRNIGISWQLSDRHGWGVFGYNLVVNLIQNGPLPPALLTPPSFIGIPEETANKIESYVIESADLEMRLPQMTLLHSLGLDFHENEATRHIRARANIAFSFFEETGFAPDAVSRARDWDRLLVGSSWNKDICTSFGISNVAFVSQGVDTTRFTPSPKRGTPSGRFVVFSGGKLEYRKGQDLVLAAFKNFHARHPDSLLITAWQNNWTQSARSIAQSPHITESPEVSSDGQIRITEWAVANGVPANAFVDLGWVSNARMPAILNEVDVAVFPSRCEGGTNLVAMEAMASGVACILSNNTGHLDIINGNKNCYPLLQQNSVEQGSRAEWRESDVDEITEAMETAYQHSEDRLTRGEEATASMAELSWKHQTRVLTDQIHHYL